MDLLFNDFLYGNYRTRKFADIFPQESVFSAAVSNSGIPLLIKDTSLTTLYYLLYARYGNSPISSSDENRFKYELYSIIYSKGPTWEKKLEVQSKLRNLTDEDLVQGSKAVYNTALNPGTAPSTDTLSELPYINQQNTTKYKKTKLEGYALLLDLLETDVTTDFIDAFKKLFNPFGSETPLYYKINGSEEQ